MANSIINTWPGGIRQSLSQDEHKRYNSTPYPGTRQLCSLCGEPTGRCEEDSMYLFNTEDPICENCYCKEV